ncbi:hypothetical protein FPSE5266_20254 [Fusarium pseudograminearum]|nr:hypothetical protein FPSE5266_20254 [Fusarium pseudograminearum]
MYGLDHIEFKKDKADKAFGADHLIHSALHPSHIPLSLFPRLLSGRQPLVITQPLGENHETRSKLHRFYISSGHTVCA